MAWLKYTPNPFEDFTLETEVRSSNLGGCIIEFFEYHPDYVGMLRGGKLQITINDLVLSPDPTFFKLQIFDGDVINITPVMHGDWAAVLVYALISTVLSYAISWVFQPDDPTMDDMSGSAAYGWDSTTVHEEGSPIPLTFGAMMVAPAIISSYIESKVQYHRKYMEEGDNTFTLSAKGSTDWVNSFTVTKDGDNNGIDGIMVIFTARFEDASRLDEVVPVEIMQYRVKPVSTGVWSDWSDDQYVAMGSNISINTAQLFIEGIDLETSYDVEIKYISKNMGFLNLVSDSSVVTPINDKDTRKNVDFIDTVKCRCKTIDHYETEKQHLRVLCAWGEGPIAGVGGLWLDDQPYQNFDDGNDQNGKEVILRHRLGNDTQDTIPGFDEAVEAVTANFPYNIDDINDTATVEMDSTGCTKIVLGFKCRAYDVSSSGRLLSEAVDYTVELSTDGVSFTDYGTYTIKSKNTRHVYKSLVIDNLTADKYWVKVTHVGDMGDRAVQDLEWIYLNAYTPIGYTYPGTALTAIDLLATDRMGNFPSIRALIFGLLITVPRVQISGTTVNFWECYWDDYDEVYRHMGNATYDPDTECDALTTTTVEQWSPNPFHIYYTILTNDTWGMGHKIPAAKVNATEIMTAGKWADELVKADTSSNSVVEKTSTVFGASTAQVTGASWATDVHAGKWVKVEDGDYAGQIRRIESNTSDTLTFYEAWSDQPVNGTTISIINYMEKRYEFHGTLDQFKKVIDVVNSILFIAHAHPAKIGTTYTAITDRSRDACGIFNTSNVIEGTFQETLPVEIPTHFEGTFKDATDSFNISPHEIVSANWTNTDKVIKLSWNLWGIISLSRAIAFLTYMKDKTEQCSRSANCEIMIDNLDKLPGDVVKLASKVVEWGISGFVESAGTDGTGDYVVIDQEVTLEVGDTYTLAMRIDGEVETYDIDEASTGTGVEVTKLYIVGSWSTTPEHFADKYILRNVTDSIMDKEFTIERIERKDDNICSVELLEYNSTVYDDSAIVPTQIVSGLVAKIPPAVSEIIIELGWDLDETAKIYKPHIFITVKYDEEDLHPDSIIKSVVYYFHVENGDTSATTLDELSYEKVIEYEEDFISVDAETLHDKTIYANASLRDQQNRKGPVLSKSTVESNAYYVDVTTLSYQAPYVTDIYIDTDAGDDSGYTYYKNTYDLFLAWEPVGWRPFLVITSENSLNFTSSEGGPVDITMTNGYYTGSEMATHLEALLNADDTLTGTGTITFTVSWDIDTHKLTINAGAGNTISIDYSECTGADEIGFTADASGQTITSDRAARYVPVVDWNSGDNYYNLSHYVLAWAVVNNDGDYPNAVDINFATLPDAGTIFDNNGTIITDRDTLNTICGDACSLKLPGLPYASAWIAYTVLAVMKDGRIGIDKSSPGTGWGLDWDWLQVTGPGGANDVTSTDITNLEVVLTMVKGLVHLCEVHWDYTLEAPAIDGFVLCLRYQPHWWLWETDATWLIGGTDKPSLDTSTHGGDSAWTNLKALMTKWKSEGISYCYFSINDGTANQEIIRCNLTTTVIDGTWALERGQEGTSAREWSSGAYFQFCPSPYTDIWNAIEDTEKRQMISNEPIPIKQALSLSMFAYKLISEDPGYLRSNLTPITTVTVE